MRDEQFRRILHRFGLSWKGYRRVRKGVKKRLCRHMQELNCRSLDEYLQILERDPWERRRFEHLMSVSISRFFRDRALWETLQKEILPRLIEKNRQGVKVWFAGCACGEEVYSFRIVWDRLVGLYEPLPPLSLLATDIHPGYLERAQEGTFSHSSLKEVPEQIRLRYFTGPETGEGDCRIDPALKRGISWKCHNLLGEPPGRDFHLIFLRNNLLTYYDEALSGPAFQGVAACLTPGGFMIIGSHEKPPYDPPELSPFSRFAYIFRRREPVDHQG